MEKFAGYGFNKSHSAAYALVAYQTAWLKAHYPAEFMAAVLSSDMDNTDKVVIFNEECQRIQLSLLPPDINHGFYRFTVNEAGVIVYGLGAIKGVGEAVVDAIVTERASNGAYRNLFDFCQRMDLKKVNRRVLEALICSGAMDCFNVDRATLMASYDRAVQLADMHMRNQNMGQADLFGMLEPEEMEPTSYIIAKPWTESRRLQGEKDTLGMYFSGHPIVQYQAELAAFTSGRIADLQVTYTKAVVIAGFVVNMRILMTKRGDRMAFLSLDDRSGRIEVAVFSDVLQQCREVLNSEQLLIIEGEVSLDDYNGGLRMSANAILTLEQAREAYGKHIVLPLGQQQISSTWLTQLDQIIQKHPGSRLPMVVDYGVADAACRVALPHTHCVKPTDVCLEELIELCGGQVRVEYTVI
jgi:DNA polymerase-3 subunit alpha